MCLPGHLTDVFERPLPTPTSIYFLGDLFRGRKKAWVRAGLQIFTHLNLGCGVGKIDTHCLWRFF